MRSTLALLVIAAATTAALAALPPGGQTEEPVPGFALYHLDSRRGGIDFIEVFLVESVTPAWAVGEQDVEIRMDGEPFNVTWQQPDGALQRNDTFTFEMEAFDIQHILTAHWGGHQVMACRFGGGAGNHNIHPDDMRALDNGHLVRCLDEIDDN